MSTTTRTRRPARRIRTIFAALALATVVTSGAITAGVITPPTANAETPAERCARETAAYNNAWAQSWAATNGKPASQAPPPPVPYVCTDPNQQPTTSTPTTTEQPGIPTPTNTNPGTGPNIGVHAPTDIPDMGNRPIVTTSVTTTPSASRSRALERAEESVHASAHSAATSTAGRELRKPPNTTESPRVADVDERVAADDTRYSSPAVLWWPLLALLTAGLLGAVTVRRGRGLRGRQNYVDDDVESIVPFPITDGRDYLTGNDPQGMDKFAQVEAGVFVTGEATYVTKETRNGEVQFYDRIQPMGPGSKSSMTRNSVRVWRRRDGGEWVDVTDQSKIVKTDDGVRGTIPVNEFDEVIIRHQSITTWDEKYGNQTVHRKARGDVLGSFKVINDGRILEDARDISENNHSWDKHQGEIPGIVTQDDYTDMIYETMRWAPPGDRKDLPSGRRAWWNGQRGVLVVHDPGGDGGSAYVPDKGRKAFEELEPR